MNGTVLYYYPDVQTGLIKAEDGKEYVFTKVAWSSEIEPKKGQLVHFEVEVDVIISKITVVKINQKHLTGKNEKISFIDDRG
jgi:cold shock CspA family protein